MCTGSGETEFAAGVGYDEASGLGSVDLYKLMTAWPAATAATPVAAASTTTVTAASATVAPGANDTITITVAPAAGDTVTTTPTGSVQLTVGTTHDLDLAGERDGDVYLLDATAGQYEITANYTGDTVYGESSGQYLVTVAGTAAPSTTPTFTVGGDECDGGRWQHRNLDGDGDAEERVYGNGGLGRGLCGADDDQWLLQHYQYGGERDGSGDDDADGVYELGRLLDGDDHDEFGGVGECAASVRDADVDHDGRFGGDPGEGSVWAGADGNHGGRAAGGRVHRPAVARAFVWWW